MHKVFSSQYSFEDLYPWRHIWRNIPLKISRVGMWYDENYIQARFVAQVGRLVRTGPWGEQEVLFWGHICIRSIAFGCLACVSLEWPARSWWTWWARCSAVQREEEPTLSSCLLILCELVLMSRFLSWFSYKHITSMSYSGDGARGSESPISISSSVPARLSWCHATTP